MAQKRDWMKLDNVAKIFPSTSSKSNTGVFRFYCELDEPVTESILQKALDIVIKKFPHFLSVMRSGLFWYYLEASDIHPIVHKEQRGVCAPLFNKNKRSLLFDLSYYNNRINFEVFHALTDGTGAIQFLKEIVFCYFSLIDKSISPELFAQEHYDAPISRRSEDSFLKYYKKSKTKKTKLPGVSYHITGQASDDYLVTEGIMSAKSISCLAKKHNTTITVFLSAILVMAIKNEMLLYKEKKPVVLTVPVNLRQYFESETARNFFGSIRVAYQITGNDSLDDIISSLSDSFKQELTEEKLSSQISGYMSAERNIFAKIVPLTIKNFFLRIARFISDRGETIVVSNIGRINPPKEIKDKIKASGFFASTKKIQICICSVNDTLSAAFCSHFYETDIQREFFKLLSELDVEITIRSNIPE